ncbi:MAG: stage V sporulation protein AD, partial [Clostridia bacterium]|nr:stage V sporulation protein AD [Clostridia bacterium]
MTSKKNPGKHTAYFPSLPSVAGYAAVTGQKEGEGPLGKYFDLVGTDPYFSQKTWEKAESEIQSLAFEIALKKADLTAKDIERLFAGDLLNQCISSSLAHKEDCIPYVGLYGACSTMAESISLAAMAIDGGYAEKTAAITSSHFCSAERQYRMPLEYGGQRPPCAQWTTTASGCVILSKNGGGPVVCASVTGEIVDAGIKDANNMGAAMAPA